MYVQSLPLVQLVTSIYTESSGGSEPAEPAEPGAWVQHSTACKPQFCTATCMHCFELGQKKTFSICFLSFQELLEKLKEAEESHSTLQAECDQYRTVLAETVSKLNI